MQPGDYDTISRMFNIHGKVGGQRIIKDFLSKLMVQVDEVYSDRLTGLIVYVSAQTYKFDQEIQPYQLLEMAKHVGYLELINKKLRQAICVSKKRYEEKYYTKDKHSIASRKTAATNLFFLYSIGARWLYRHHISGNEQQEALAHSKEATKLYKNLPYNYDVDTDPLAIWISHRYLSQAKEFPVDSLSERQLIDKIKGFCPPGHVHHTEKRFPLRQRDVNNLLGFYYADRKQISLAMKYLKREVEIGIGLLSNETKDDD